jgi:hypothetical protein
MPGGRASLNRSHDRATPEEDRADGVGGIASVSGLFSVVAAARSEIRRLKQRFRMGKGAGADTRI